MRCIIPRETPLPLVEIVDSCSVGYSTTSSSSSTSPGPITVTITPLIIIHIPRIPRLIPIMMRITRRLRIRNKLAARCIAIIRTIEPCKSFEGNGRELDGGWEELLPDGGGCIVVLVLELSLGGI